MIYNRGGGVLDLSIIQGPFSVAPCQTLISRFFATFSLAVPRTVAGGGASEREGGGAGGGTVGSGGGGGGGGGGMNKGQIQVVGEARLGAQLTVKGIRGIDRTGQWRFQWQRVWKQGRGQEKVETLPGAKGPHHQARRALPHAVLSLGQQRNQYALRNPVLDALARSEHESMVTHGQLPCSSPVRVLWWWMKK
jgi:hypothetical protein